MPRLLIQGALSPGRPGPELTRVLPVSSSTIDAKGNYNSNLSYIGTINSTPPTYDPGILHKDF